MFHFRRRNIWIEFVVSLTGLAVIISLIYFVVLNFANRSNQNSTQSSSSQIQVINDAIVVTASNFTRPISKDFLCYNNNFLLIPDWQDTNLIESVKKINPSLIRTGGAEANYFNWQKGGLFEQPQNGIKTPFPYEFIIQNQATQANLAQFYQDTNTKPVWVLNLLTDTLESQVFRLKDAKSKGMDITYIELGSDLYLGSENSPDGNKLKFPQPIDYALEAKKWTAKLQSEFPDSKIAYIAQTGVSQTNQSKIIWNDTVSAQLSQNQAFSLHVYGANGLLTSNLSNENVGQVLIQPSKTWQLAQQDIKVLNPEQKIWVTEYNIFEQGSEVKTLGTWVSGLYNLSLDFQIMSDPRVEMACNHVLIGNSQWASIYGTQSSLKTTWNQEFTPYSLSPTGYTLSLLSKALDGAKSATKLDFSKQLTQTLENGSSYSGFEGWSFSDGTQTKILILNQSASKAKVDLSQSFPSGGRRFQISSNPNTLVTGPKTIQNDSATFENDLDIPAYSVTLVTAK